MQGGRLPVIAAASVALLAAGAMAYRFALPAPAGIACKAPAAAFARLELLFGMGKKGGGEISDREWQAFLDAEVTPRFPDGLTVLTGYGQWRNSAGAITKENARVLLVWYKPGADVDARVEAIRTAYKTRFGQESVMRVDGVSCVSF